MPNRAKPNAIEPRGRRKPHPVVFSGAIGFSMFVAVVVALLIRHNDLPAETDWRIVGWGLLVALGGWVRPMLRWRQAWIELEGDRLRWISGRWRAPQVDVGLGEIRGLAIDQTWVGRWLDYAELRLVDAEGKEHTFPAVSGVDPFRRAAKRCGRDGRRG